MIRKIIDKHLEKMAEEMLKLNDKEIQNFIKELRKEGVDHEVQVDFMKTILSQVLIESEEDQQEAMYEQMEQFVRALQMHGESYLFHVELKDPVIRSTREIRMPAFMMVSDLAYAVLAAYGALGSHMFSLTYKKDRFMLNDEEWDAIPADMVPLGALEMRLGNTIKMEYDFGESWEFTIKYKGKKKVDTMFNAPELLDGEGYNIWEDNRELLWKLIEDPKQIVNECVGEEITVGECAEGEHITLLREDQKEEFINEILELKMSYEQLNESDDLDDFSGEYQA